MQCLPSMQGEYAPDIKVHFVKMPPASFVMASVPSKLCACARTQISETTHKHKFAAQTHTDPKIIIIRQTVSFLVQKPLQFRLKTFFMFLFWLSRTFGH